MQIVDICAGAGGKSLVMAASMQNKGRILALDPNIKRLDQCGKRLRLAGIHNVERKLVAEKWSSRSWRAKFDRVVIDAPCSGSGTWRRQVDARWQLTAEQLNEIKKTQSILLEKARAMVVPGGPLFISLFSSCQRGTTPIKQFLANAPEIEIAIVAIGLKQLVRMAVVATN